MRRQPVRLTHTTWCQLFLAPFEDFVATNHPDDRDTMWVRHASGNVDGPQLTERSFELLEQCTAEYVEAVDQPLS